MQRAGTEEGTCVAWRIDEFKYMETNTGGDKIEVNESRRLAWKVPMSQ